jgi:hypothetical protein
MRLPWQIVVFAAAVALSVGIWIVSGGRAFVFLAPLIFGLPLLGRRR